MRCQECGIEFEGRTDAKYCSPNCKLKAFRRKSIETDSVTLSEIPETDNFEFYTETVDRVSGAGKVKGERHPNRTAKYWYDVPLGAMPIIKKGRPDKPSYMNGRQYFLWWKNEFKEDERGPVILNPYPQHEGPVEYIRAAEGSRRLGA